MSMERSTNEIVYLVSRLPDPASSSELYGYSGALHSLGSAMDPKMAWRSQKAMQIDAADTSSVKDEVELLSRQTERPVTCPRTDLSKSRRMATGAMVRLSRSSGHRSVCQLHRFATI